MIRAAALLVLLAGCHLSYLPRQPAAHGPMLAEPSAACTRANRSAIIATGFAAGLGIAGGSSGVAAILTATDKVPLYAATAVGLAFSVGAGVSGVLATTYGTRAAAACEGGGVP